jgi:hypothetical protein
MSEALLGQNITLVYKWVNYAIEMRHNQQWWEALCALQSAANELYEDAKDTAELDELDNVIEDIEEEAKNTVSQSRDSSERRLFNYDSYKNRRAAQVFNHQQKQIKRYMQRVGYYTLMNKGWDSRITPTATMKVQQQPPQTKKYSEKLSGELI